MHVLFTIHSLSGGGAERVTITLANYWAGKGWRVTIVTMVGKDSDFYVLDDRINHIALDLVYSSSTILHSVYHNLVRVRALRAVLRSEKPDVAIAMMVTANALLALAGTGLGIELFGSERNYPPAMQIGPVWEKIRRWTYPKLSMLVAQTAKESDWFRKNTAVRNIAVIPNPVNYPIAAQAPRVSPDAELEMSGCDRTLLAVGRLVEQKGFDRLIAAFASISRKYPRWDLIILGEGHLRGALEMQALALEVSERVHMPGLVGNVGDWFESADIYVLTSRFEGFPNTLLEALAYGLPAVAIDCDVGPRDILSHSVDGLLVSQDDPEALVSALEQLMSDSEMRQRFARRAPEVLKRYSVAQIATMWEDLFRLKKDSI